MTKFLIYYERADGYQSTGIHGTTQNSETYCFEGYLVF